ncbi:hypothetical protein FHX42_004953 [Saccharopolyspora lacisalsi]|uniref:Uncharacterized protein n=1 Tax=Halosaccharopolyspora lacisalsi TaxID=1000566 RepID=A0A839E781_9PSEU|nr:hypothetical protein [Halosaccharopolyspora lacisalsi]
MKSFWGKVAAGLSSQPGSGITGTEKSLTRSLGDTTGRGRSVTAEQERLRTSRGEDPP